MSTSDTLTDQWLASVMSTLGDSDEKVAEILSEAQIKGYQRNPQDCPVARYVASRTREYLPCGAATITVTVTHEVIVCIDVTRDDTFWMIRADVPESVGEFITAFDNATHEHDLYADLALRAAI